MALLVPLLVLALALSLTLAVAVGERPTGATAVAAGGEHVPHDGSAGNTTAGGALAHRLPQPAELGLPVLEAGKLKLRWWWPWWCVLWLHRTIS